MNSSFAQRLWPLLLLACSIDVAAHQGSTSYLSLAVEEDHLKGRWEIPAQDLDLALQLDADKNRKVTLNELQARFADIKSYALRYLTLSVDGVSGVLVITNDQPVIEEFHDGASTALEFVVTNISSPTNLEVEYRFMFEQKPKDRAFMQVECRGITQTGVFTADQPIQAFDLKSHRPINEFRAFGWRGAWHIWTGFDHYLFLLAWLLPAVLFREENRWQTVTGFGQAFMNVFKVVTAFTLAHSLTLCLTALQNITLPARWVDAAIAGCVAVAAANNIQTVVRGRVWLLGIAFGLIHGFGFANLRPDPGTTQTAQLLALMSFNVGMEAGQLAVVMVTLPMAYVLRGASFYQSTFVKGGSGLIAVLAGAWLLDRVFDLEIFRV